MSTVYTGLVFNRISETDTDLLNIARESELKYMGLIPEDKNITDWDKKGLPSLTIPPDSPSLKALKDLILNDDTLRKAL